MSRPTDDGVVGEFIADLVRMGCGVLEGQLAVDPDQARQAMKMIADEVCVAYARRHIYVPADFDPRNREIVRKYGEATRSARPCTPERVAELAAEYALTTRQIYKILAVARAADFESRQTQLPGFATADDPPA